MARTTGEKQYFNLFRMLASAIPFATGLFSLVVFKLGYFYLAFFLILAGAMASALLQMAVVTLASMPNVGIIAEQQLLKLHESSLAVTSDLELDKVLRSIVKSARSLIGTKYGAIGVQTSTGTLINFYTSGLSRETVEAIGAPPEGKGLLGAVLKDRVPLRVDNVAEDPRFQGLPHLHPQLTNLLGVPIASRLPHTGSLFLSEKIDGSNFTEGDEILLGEFARQAARAIDNAHIHRQIRRLAATEERLHIAHEMHDGLAQILAFVNTKAQVVRELMKREDFEATNRHLDELVAAAQELWSDVRQNILDLRMTSHLEDGLVAAIREYTHRWENTHGIPVELNIPQAVNLGAEKELHLLRILQESLMNVQKHAEARQVKVYLSLDGDHFTLEDDGIGFDPEACGDQCFGLKTMQERASEVGMQFQIHSKICQGTRILVTDEMVS